MRPVSSRFVRAEPESRQVYTAAMNLFLAELGQAVAPGAHGIVLMDKAGWHTSADLALARGFSRWWRSEAGDVTDSTIYRVGSAGASSDVGDPRGRLREWASAAWCAFKCVSDAQPPGRGDRYRHLEGRGIA